MEVAASVQRLVEPLLLAEGLELVEVSFTGSRLQVFLDRPGGVDLDTIARLTTAISRLLDDHDPVPGRYTLEVSSPGLERPLRTPEHFERFVGSTVSVKTKPHVEGERRERGRLVAVDGEGIVIVPSEGPSAGRARRLSYADIDKARTVFEWGPAPKPGRGPKASAPAGTRKAAS